METRANYVLVGLFTLLGAIGILAGLVWFAKVEVDREYAYYDILFDSASGLSNAGDVRFNGVQVGQVAQIALYEEDPSKVRVRIEVAGDTPVRSDTVATLELQGVTGVSYVSLAGGDPESEPLTVVEGHDVPIIRSDVSALQSVFDGAPELLAKAIALLEDVRAVVSDENTAAVAEILQNMKNASAELDGVLTDFNAVSRDISAAGQSIAAFTEDLKPVAAQAGATLKTADDTLNTANTAIGEARTTIATATETLSRAQSAFASADTLLDDGIPQLVADLQGTVTTIRSVVDQAGPNVTALLSDARTVTGNVDQTLAEARGAIADLRTSLVTVNQTAAAAQTLIEGDGTALIGDLRGAARSAESLATNIDKKVLDDTNALLVSLQQASAKAGPVIEDLEQALALVSTRVDTLSASADETLKAVTKTARSADTLLVETQPEFKALMGDLRTLAAGASARVAEAEKTLALAEATLTSLSSAAGSADQLLSKDAPGLVADARTTLGSINAVAERVQGPALDEVMALVGDARGAVKTVQPSLAEASRALSGLAGSVDGLSAQANTALSSATETFRRANETLSFIDGAVISAQRIMDDDLDPILGNLSDAAGNVSIASQKAAILLDRDIPALAQDLRGTVRSAGSLLDNLDGLVGDNRTNFTRFVQAGLPQIVRFVQEARALTQNLERLTTRIESDPARFLFGTQAPEYTATSQRNQR